MTGSVMFAVTRNVPAPTRGHQGDAGIDLYVPVFDEKFKNDLDELAMNGYNEKRLYRLVTGSNGNKLRIVLDKHGRILIPMGVHVNLEYASQVQSDNYVHLTVANKSGIATKHGLIYGAHIIDRTYQGEIMVSVINTSQYPVYIDEGVKLVQVIPLVVNEPKIKIVDIGELFSYNTTRGAAGFGSTDNKK